MRRKHPPAIFISGRRIRIGRRIFPGGRFHDTVIEGWHLAGLRIVQEGTFIQRPWSDEAIARYYRDAYRSWACYRLLDVLLWRVIKVGHRKPGDSRTRIAFCSLVGTGRGAAVPA